MLRSFNLSGLPSQTEIELTDADTIAVPGLFGSGRPAGVALRVTATGGATAIGTSAALVVRAEALGDALVTLGVSAPGYRDTTATLAVRIVPGICPPPAPAGFADLYPITNGITTQYIYLGSLSDFNSVFPYTTSNTGVLIAEIDNIACLNRRRTFRLIYRATGTATTTISGSPQPPSTVSFERVFTYTVAEDSANVVKVPLPGITIGLHNVVIPRYAVQAELALEARLLDCRLGSTGATIFREGVGLVNETLTCISSTRSSSSQSLTLQP